MFWQVLNPEQSSLHTGETQEFQNVAKLHFGKENISHHGWGERGPAPAEPKSKGFVLPSNWAAAGGSCPAPAGGLRCDLAAGVGSWEASLAELSNSRLVVFVFVCLGFVFVKT